MMNKTLSELQTELIRLVEALSQRLGKTKKVADSKAILQEMQETQHRVAIAGQLLFHETTQAIQAQLTEVTEAVRALKEAIGEAKRIRDVIKGIGKVLTAADKALDVLKLV